MINGFFSSHAFYDTVCSTVEAGQMAKAGHHKSGLTDTQSYGTLEVLSLQCVIKERRDFHGIGRGRLLTGKETP